MSSFYEKWKEESKNYKPQAPDQGVLWLKQMAMMSPHFQELRNGESKISINEHWMNAFGQMCYDLGYKRMDERSFDAGYRKAMQDVAEKLGFSYEE